MLAILKQTWPPPDDTVAMLWMPDISPSHHLGMVNDMSAENSNDQFKYKEIATQADFDNF